MNGVLLIVIYEGQYACASDCTVDEMNACLAEFHHYEEKAFPNYGENEAKLDETCQAMNQTLMCPYDFYTCAEDDTCTDDCHSTAMMMNAVKVRSKLPHLYSELCEGTKPFRSEYLQHASCLHQIAIPYQECYNTSTASLSYLFSNVHLINSETKCCLVSWVQQCYNTKTAEECGEQAAELVTEALKMLRQGVEEECLTQKKCDMPPLPETETEGNLDPRNTSSGKGNDEELFELLPSEKPDNSHQEKSGCLKLVSLVPTIMIFAFISVTFPYLV